MQETNKMRVQSLDQEDPLEEGMATHSSIHAWRIMDRGASQATVLWAAELEMTEWLSTHTWTEWLFIKQCGEIMYHHNVVLSGEIIDYFPLLSQS